ncbi:hypothetical protein JCM13304A_24350 [Desulfothermus okinawensis JCM 13304]
MKKRQSVIFWDYKKVSQFKKLERIALFFPQTGRDKKTVIELYNHINELNIPKEKKKIIEFYYKLIKEGELN